MTPLLKAAFTCTLLVMQISTSVAALDISEIEKRDFDSDGYIERGSELDALTLLAPQMNGRQHSAFGAFLDSDTQKIAVSNFDRREYYEKLADNCTTGKRFFLQENVSDISLYSPNVVVPSNNGALFSASRDRQNGVSNWEVRGALAWLPRGAVRRCLLTELKEPPAGAKLSAFGLAPFLSFSGTGNSDETGTSDLSIGVLAQFQIFGGQFDLQEVTLSPYFRTDFQGDAEIYGLNASWRPYLFESRLNGLRGDIGTRTYDWSLGIDTNYINVLKSGNSGLTADTSYGWVGGNLGVGYNLFDIGPGGLRFSVGLLAFRDLINDVSAIQYNAAARLGISKDKRASIELRYENGMDRFTLEEVDEVKLNLRLSF